MSEMENNNEDLKPGTGTSVVETAKERQSRLKKEAREKKEQEKREAKMAGGSGRKKKKKIGWIIALVLVVLIVGYSVVNNVVAKNTPIMVNTIAVERGTVEQTLSTSGNVNSEVKKAYYSPVSAPIVEMNISLGDTVEEGQQLVVFDTSDLEHMQTKAQLDANATANGYKSTQYQSSKKQSDYDEAHVGLDELKIMVANQEQYIQGLKYELEDYSGQQKKRLQDWVGKLNKELEIQNSKLSTQSDPDARNEIQEIIQNLNDSLRKANNELGDLGMRDDVKEKQRMIDNEQQKYNDMNEELSKRENKESSSEAGIVDQYARQQQANSVQSAQMTANEAASDLEKAKEGIKAEFSGVVTKFATVSTSKDVAAGGSVMEGATVSQGAELFTIESDKQVKVNIDVTKYDLEKIATGQKADVEIAGKIYDGEIAKINKVAAANTQGTPVVGVEIHINNPDSNIYLGVEAKVTIHTAIAENALIIPIEVVNTDKQGDFVYVIENGVVVLRRVTTGIASDSYVEIKDGLNESDQIVNDITGMITEGMKVTAMPAGAAAGDLAGDEAAESAAVTESSTVAGTDTTAINGSDNDNMAVDPATEAAGTAGTAADGTESPADDAGNQTAETKAAGAE